jgi:hypothetical protein
MKKGGEKNKARARELADSLRDRNNPPSIDAMNRIYDVVLNMNSLNSKPSDGRFFKFTSNRLLDIQSMLKEEKAKKVMERDREDEKRRMMPPPPPPPPGAMGMSSIAFAPPPMMSA